MSTPLVYLGSARIDLYGAASGIYDLGAGGFLPRFILPQADLRTNAAYKVGLLLSKGGTDIIGTNLNAAISGSAFLLANQPAGDDIEVVSDTAADTGRIVTFWATKTGVAVAHKGTATLNGDTAVTATLADGTAKASWGMVLGAKVDTSHATAVITIRKATGDLKITDIRAGQTIADTDHLGATKNASVVPITKKGYLLPWEVAAAAASTKWVGIVGVDALGNEVYDTVQLSGATTVRGRRTAAKWTDLLVGDVAASATAATFKYSKYLTTGQLPGSLIWTAAARTITDLSNESTAPERLIPVTARYLHWCFYTGTTAAAGGIDDAVIVKLYG